MNDKVKGLLLGIVIGAFLFGTTVYALTSSKDEKPEWEEKADTIINAAHYADFLKIPYKFGAEWKSDQAFDCSSFMLNLFLFIDI